MHAPWGCTYSTVELSIDTTSENTQIISRRIASSTVNACGKILSRVPEYCLSTRPSATLPIHTLHCSKEAYWGGHAYHARTLQVLSESRLTAWQSSDGLPFAYSGKVMEPSPFSPNVLRLRDALYERTGVLYDGVLLNLYESKYGMIRAS